MAGFDILTIVGDPWNDVESPFGGIKLSIIDTASRTDSKFLEFMLNNAPIFTVQKKGEFFFSNAAGTARGGMALAPSAAP